MSDALIAPVVSTRTPWTGTSLPDGISGLTSAIRSEGWVDDLLAGGSLAIEGVSITLDPLSALLANGLGWAMEYFDPLREMLDRLTGMPDVVAAHAASWDRMATELADVSATLQSQVSADLPDWQGAAADAYRAMMTCNVQAAGGLGAASSAMAAATQAAGNLVRFTRDIVRDLIADLVARVIVWAAEALFVVTIPLVAAQIAGAVTKWAGRLLGYTSALVTSLRNLSRIVGA
ncbi:WXG100 family type VII secretion target [Actinoplanes sp. TBRC 11911]|uniref:WXG100 family type VII secretion target n=1 Tax=Actinoplanes sp. TBRC 11911 TaxID=2729386 RepID=UPI00145E29A3|nr:WXG100 family type VII secretion target [Actinoplanes sp. TBRC 11911]NMO53538.1 WXG100 family type VII secretion target [Actinoplanes sp. TBRC 11911]